MGGKEAKLGGEEVGQLEKLQVSGKMVQSSGRRCRVQVGWGKSGGG